MNMKSQVTGGKKMGRLTCFEKSFLFLALTLVGLCLSQSALAQKIADAEVPETVLDTNQASASGASVTIHNQRVDEQSVTTNATVNAEVQTLKRELAEQRKQIEELRRMLLSQKPQTDSVKQPSAPSERLSHPSQTGRDRRGRLGSERRTHVPAFARSDSGIGPAAGSRSRGSALTPADQARRSLYYAGWVYGSDQHLP